MRQSLSSFRSTAGSKLARYTDPAGHFAFRTYDHLYGTDGPLQPSDVLMANLLSLRLTWAHVVPMFADGEGPGQKLRWALEEALIQLKHTNSFEDHADVNSLEETVAPVARANSLTDGVPGWTAVTVSKVLHRRRPHIVPLLDSRVRAFYGARKPRVVREALWEDLQQNRDWMAEVVRGHSTPDGRPLTLLRAADILIWTP